MTEFVAFGKIPRLSRECVVTEKIDGTNAQVYIMDAPNLGGKREPWPSETEPYVIAEREDGKAMMAGSRNRWLSLKSDNFGFAAWVKANSEMLFRLGYGHHFGEWWGSGIQRGYGLVGGEKRFSLFNVARHSEDRPACCGLVPVLYGGPFDTAAIHGVLYALEASGSSAAPGFMRPEGIVVFHRASGTLFKKTIQDDEKPKGSAE